MTRDSQLNWARQQLLTRGRVSRNQALRRYFSRLSARILDLKRDGMKIVGRAKPTKHGKDYVYELVQ